MFYKICAWHSPSPQAAQNFSWKMKKNVRRPQLRRSDTPRRPSRRGVSLPVAGGIGAWHTPSPQAAPGERWSMPSEPQNLNSFYTFNWKIFGPKFFHMSYWIQNQPGSFFYFEGFLQVIRSTWPCLECVWAEKNGGNISCLGTFKGTSTRTRDSDFWFSSWFDFTSIPDTGLQPYWIFS